MTNNTSDYKKYEDMRDDGATPEAVYLEAKQDSWNELECFKILKAVFDLSLREIKEASIRAYDSDKSLDKHQSELSIDLSSLVDHDDIDTW